MYHSKIVDELKIFGGQFAEEEDHGLHAGPYALLFNLLAEFSTLQQLALHAFRRHGVVAQNVITLNLQSAQGA